MINLHDTWIENKEGELKNLWLTECERQGLSPCTDTTLTRSFNALEACKDAIYCIDKCKLEKGSKQVFLSDLKPRVKVEYVKVDPNEDSGSYWECARDFANGIEFTQTFDPSEHRSVKDNDQLLLCYKSKVLYRKVEREVTWKDEVRTLLSPHFIGSDNGYLSIDGLMESLNGWDEEVIKTCHLVASLTK